MSVESLCDVWRERASPRSGAPRSSRSRLSSRTIGVIGTARSWIHCSCVWEVRPPSWPGPGDARGARRVVLGDRTLAGLIARVCVETALAGGGRMRSAAGPEFQRVRDARLNPDSSHQEELAPSERIHGRARQLQATGQAAAAGAGSSCRPRTTTPTRPGSRDGRHRRRRLRFSACSAGWSARRTRSGRPRGPSSPLRPWRPGFMASRGSSASLEQGP